MKFNEIFELNMDNPIFILAFNNFSNCRDDKLGRMLSDSNLSPGGSQKKASDSSFLNN